MIATTRVGTIVTHGGATGGYVANAAFDPVRRRGVIVLANAMTQPGVDDIPMHLLTGSPISIAPPYLHHPQLGRPLRFPAPNWTDLLAVTGSNLIRSSPFSG